MKNGHKLWAVLLVAASLLLAGGDADARRLGGGRSLGRQSANVTQRQATPPAAPAAPSTPGQSLNNAAVKPAAPPAPGAVQPARSRWGGLLGGVVAGLGLAWLAHTLGLGAAFGQFLLIALLALVVLALWRMFAARSRAGAVRAGPGGLAFEGMGQSPANAASPVQYSPRNVGNDASARPWEQGHAALDAGMGSAGSGVQIGSALAGAQAWGIPAGFDAEGFLAAAKRNFVTLQDAWDRADIATLRTLMTDGMVDEIRTQLAEREQHTGGQPNKTEVVMLDAQLLGIEQLPDVYLASVEFSGVIREDACAGPSPFREVWNMSKPADGSSGWLVAGVQALQ